MPPTDRVGALKDGGEKEDEVSLEGWREKEDEVQRKGPKVMESQGQLSLLEGLSNSRGT